VCPLRLETLRRSLWYDHFEQVSDEEVRKTARGRSDCRWRENERARRELTIQVGEAAARRKRCASRESADGIVPLAHGLHYPPYPLLMRNTLRISDRLQRRAYRCTSAACLSRSAARGRKAIC